MVYYRSDLIDTPPTTWDEYLTVAAEFHGQDLNERRRRPTTARASPRRRASRATGGSSRSPAACSSPRAPRKAPSSTRRPWTRSSTTTPSKKALETYKKTMDYGPPDETNLGVGDTRGLFTTGRCALSMDWGDIGTLALDPGHLDRPGQGRRGDHAGLEGNPRPRERQARAVRRHDLPERGRRRELRPVRLVRWLVRRDQRRGRRHEEGRGLRVPRLHERTRPVERGRDARQDRLQPVPDLALREPGAVEGGRHERCGRGTTTSGPSRRVSRTRT